MRTINNIIVHCSDSDYGDVSVIDGWHRQKGWDGIGYHRIITNGHLKELGSPYSEKNDGVVQQGRPIEIQGAHCKGKNEDSIGVVLIGRHHFTAKQLIVALPTELATLCSEYSILIKDIYPHWLFNADKSCPNIPHFAFHLLTDMVEANLKLEGK